MADERKIEFRYRDETIFKQMLEALRILASEDDSSATPHVGMKLKNNLVFIGVSFEGRGGAARVIGYGSLIFRRHRLFDAIVALFGPTFAVAVSGVSPYEKQSREIVYLKPHPQGSQSAHEMLGAMTTIQRVLRAAGKSEPEIDCLLA